MKEALQFLSKLLNLLFSMYDFTDLNVKLYQSEVDIIDIPGYFSQLHYCGWSLGSECDMLCPASLV